MGTSESKSKDPRDKCRCKRIHWKDWNESKNCIAYNHQCICRKARASHGYDYNDGRRYRYNCPPYRHDGPKYCKSHSHVCSCSYTGASNCIAKIHDDRCVCIRDCKHGKNSCKAPTHNCICTGYRRRMIYECKAEEHPCICLRYIQQRLSTRLCKATDHPCVCHEDKEECMKHKNISKEEMDKRMNIART